MCGCGKSSGNSPARATTVRTVRSTHASSAHAVPPRAEPDTVQLEYLGARALLVRGPVSGVGYACYPGDTVTVYSHDAERLVAGGDFQQVRATERKRA